MIRLRFIGITMTFALSIALHTAALGSPFDAPTDRTVHPNGTFGVLAILSATQRSYANGQPVQIGLALATVSSKPLILGCLPPQLATTLFITSEGKTLARDPAIKFQSISFNLAQDHIPVAPGEIRNCFQEMNLDTWRYNALAPGRYTLTLLWSHFPSDPKITSNSVEITVAP